MNISVDLFEAFIKCSTKCWLRASGEPTSGNAYAEWEKVQNKFYRDDAAKRLIADVPANECEVAPVAENLKNAKWRLAVGIQVCMPFAPRVSTHAGSGGIPSQENSYGDPCPPAKGEAALIASKKPAPPSLVACLHAVERVPSAGRGKPTQFTPIRFVFTNKLTKDDRLLLAFDSLVLSEALGRDIAVGQIIHADDHATLKARTSALALEVRKHLEKIAALLSNPTPPDLVLNRHCAECEFQSRCRQKATEKYDLSLLAGMSEKEPKKFRSKGIFTVTQLSYTFCWLSRPNCVPP
jgi:predicted RecB family nuclease